MSAPLPSKSVLGKRKTASGAFYIPRESGDDQPDEADSDSESASEYASSDDDEQHEFSSESSDEQGDEITLKASTLRVQGGGLVKSRSSSELILVNGHLVPKTRKRYVCTYPGCTKKYTKPTRLAEHERSHTGERPFVCLECPKSYLRESHLAAHLRTHRGDEEKPFVCDEDGCGKRFWTAQHLKRHVAGHNGEKPFACEKCEEKFSKNWQLRKHVVDLHAVPGSKSFLCEAEGCGKSFGTSQKLNAHAKVHQVDRYACSHPSCSTRTSQFFQTWSALQGHMKAEHPPTCPFSACAGKTFASQRGLRAHLSLHQEDGVDGEEPEEGGAAKKKRKSGSGGFDCPQEGCEKAFKTEKGLKTHQKTTHLGLRPFKCEEPGCGQAFGYKHVLQRHHARHHTSTLNETQPFIKAEPSEALLSPRDEPNPGLSVIALLTGSLPQKERARSFPCPWPDLLESPFDPTTHGSCHHVSSRLYDLRRHLKAAHAFEIDAESLSAWAGAGM